jgi:hypothetical protein
VDPDVIPSCDRRLIGMGTGEDMHLPSSRYKVDGPLGQDGAGGAGGWGVDAVNK